MSKADEIISKLRECEDIQLNNFRVEREKINGMQEGYQLAMMKARQIISEYIRNEEDTKWAIKQI